MSYEDLLTLSLKMAKKHGTFALFGVRTSTVETISELDELLDPNTETMVRDFASYIEFRKEAA